MQFLNEGAPFMLAGMVGAYDKLKHDLNQLRSELNLSEKRNDLVVIRFCDLILKLITKTSSMYLEIESAHTRPSINNINNVQNNLPEKKDETDYPYFSYSQ